VCQKGCETVKSELKRQTKGRLLKSGSESYLHVEETLPGRGDTRANFSKVKLNVVIASLSHGEAVDEVDFRDVKVTLGPV